MTARTRVLHVITHLDRGGATDNTLLSVAGLDRSRYEVDLAAGPGALEASAGSAADRLLVVPALGRALRPTRDLRAAVALWRLAAGYDVVHTHTAKAGVLGRLAARARGVPVVVHTIHAFPVHDGMSPARTGSSPSARPTPPRRWPSASPRPASSGWCPAACPWRRCGRAAVRRSGRRWASRRARPWSAP